MKHSNVFNERNMVFRIRAMRLILQVWLDQYPCDFNDPPAFPLLCKLKDFTGEQLRASELDNKVQYRIEKMRKDNEAKGILY